MPFHRRRLLRALTADTAFQGKVPAESMVKVNAEEKAIRFNQLTVEVDDSQPKPRAE